MIRYVEPNEQAYSIMAPSGWAISGGIQRRSVLQPHSVLGLRSPGGATFTLYGNPQAIAYSTPTPLGYQIGFREGALYSPNGDPLIIRRYETGQQFATTTGQRLLQQGGCQSIKVENSRPRPFPANNTMGGMQSSTAGEVFFACEKGGYNFDAYMFSVTTMFGQPASNVGAVWNGDTSFFFVTPHGYRDETGALMSRIISSVQMNQQWVSQQIRAAGASAEAATRRLDEAMAAQAKTLRHSFGKADENRASTQEEMNRLVSGFDEYQDSAGNRHAVPYGQATNWFTNGLGDVVGTQGRAPGLNWTEMNRVPTGR